MAHPRWRSHRPPDSVVRGAGSYRLATLEQDAAAGGHERRLVSCRDGSVATASIALHMPAGSRRVWAYLRYKSGGRTYRTYVGEATADTREEALRHAWRLVRERNLVATIEERAPDRR
jgi:hypothetical protein